MLQENKIKLNDQITNTNQNKTTVGQHCCPVQAYIIKKLAKITGPNSQWTRRSLTPNHIPAASHPCNCSPTTQQTWLYNHGHDQTSLSSCSPK